ncbi:hypothetical protein LCL97_10300 [Seohaeicola saemankumensis]|nr:hypothetical protein [Seohaeicola saemankumensis]MCA0871220.1 hypothetical protein [Seohaeicola saemankumensis]
MTRVLVLGFSVSAGRRNYVFEAARTMPHDIDLVRTAMGGWMPLHLAHIMEHVLDQSRPDAVVFEVATSGIYVLKEDILTQSLTRLATACLERDIPFSFLNLPRLDLQDGSADTTEWVREAVTDFARACRVPVRNPILIAGDLEDYVHPSETGMVRYARCLTELLEWVPNLSTKHIHDPGPEPFHVGFDMVSALWSGPLRDRPHDRNGFACPVMELPSGDSVEFETRDGTTAVGIGVATNLLAGQLLIEDLESDVRIVLDTYTPHSYYERPLLQFFKGASMRRFRVTQLPDPPTVKLIKGEPDSGARVGSILGLALRTTPPHPESWRALHVPVDIAPETLRSAPPSAMAGSTPNRPAATT